MPSLIKIKVEKGRELPVMDRNSSADASTDAFVEVKVDTHIQKTNTCRKSLNPVWNEEFVFEIMDDSVLQDCPVEIRCMDQDLYSSDLIGVIYVDLNPLIMRTTQGSEKDLFIRGWFPLFDTLRGVRGSLQLSIKLQFIGNDNPFRDSSAGVQFFSASKLSPKCFHVQEICGFVEDLVVEDDPENSWQDYFRKGNKSSNDTKLKTLYNLSATVRRELGKKVLEAGCNAVLGYSVSFDLEGASVVARAYGTACKLLKVDDSGGDILFSRNHFEHVTSSEFLWDSLLSGAGNIAMLQRDTAEILSPRLGKAIGAGSAATTTAIGEAFVLLQAVSPTVGRAVQLIPFAGLNKEKVHRDTIAGAGVLAGGGAARGGKDYGNMLDWNMTNLGGENSYMIQAAEVQLLSLRVFPPYVKVKLGGLVVARSVKFLGKLEQSLSDQETREGWWQELREEIKAHAKVMCCKHIIGYSEMCSVIGDVCVLSAMGTAAVLKGLTHPSTYLTLNPHADSMSAVTSPKRTLTRGEMARSTSRDDVDDNSAAPATFDTPMMAKGSPATPHSSGYPKPPSLQKAPSTDSVLKMRSRDNRDALVEDSPETSAHRGILLASVANRKKRTMRTCACTHVPYNHTTAPFSFMRLVPCLSCKRKWVPEIILSTTEPPAELNIRGKGQLLEAKVCRIRKVATGEADAVKISEVLPFVEYDLQRQLMLKLKVLGMNAVFGYTCRLQVGSHLVVATASCTAVYLESLPAPPLLQIVRNNSLRSAEQEARLIRMQREVEARMLYHKQQLEAVADKADLSAAATPEKSSQVGSISRKRLNQVLNYDPVPVIMEEDGEEKGFSRTSTLLADEQNGEQAHDEENETDNRTRTVSSSSSSSSSSDSSSSDDELGDDNSLESPTNSSDSDDEKSTLKGSKADIDVDDSSKTPRSRKRSDSKEDSSGGNRRTSASTPAYTMESSSKKVRSRDRKVVFKDERKPYLMEIDEETDTDILAVLADWMAPAGMDMVNTALVPGGDKSVILGHGRDLCVLRRAKLFARKGHNLLSTTTNNALSGIELSQMLSRLYQEAYERLCFEVKSMIPCQVLGISHHVNILEDGQVEIMVTAMVHLTSPKPSPNDIGWHPEIVGTVTVAPSREREGSTASTRDRPMPSRNQSLDSMYEVQQHRRQRATSHESVEGLQSMTPFNVPVSTVSAAATPDLAAEDEQRASSFQEGGRLTDGDQQASSNKNNPSLSGVKAPQPPAHDSIVAHRPASTSRVSSDGSYGPQQPSIKSRIGEGLMKSFAGGSSRSLLKSAPQVEEPPSSRSRQASSESTGTSQVLLSPLSEVPGLRVKRYLGPIQLHFIKDSWNLRGDVDSFFYLFVSEANAVARAQVVALGGNALLCHRVVSQETGGRATRNQVYNMLSVTGDAVLVEEADYDY